ncbi:rCG46079 [Rattus norvegicus]|uniref:RCG46079 n=1 Tax=Rattus norvegicus TaxID=10116 RepID=A6ICY2_RAT|nr:rCG46079 [Rattus norvegicus]
MGRKKNNTSLYSRRTPSSLGKSCEKTPLRAPVWS